LTLARAGVVLSSGRRRDGYEGIDQYIRPMVSRPFGSSKLWIESEILNKRLDMPDKKKTAAAGASQGGGAGSVRTSPRAGMAAAARTHLPGQDDFRSILPEDIDWKPFPAFPPSALLAVVVGDPAEPGPYTVRVKVPHGVKLMPHRHDEDRVYSDIRHFLHRQGRSVRRR
jgi:hypothetical protein